jgi:WD40 repeat protein
LQSADPNQSVKVLRGHEGENSAIALSEDGRWLATASFDKSVRMWDLHSPEHFAGGRTLRGHESVIDKVEVSSDGRWLITGSAHVERGANR